MPRFAVIVPAYNAAATIRETLDAMLAQEYEDWECIVVNDGSIDATAGIVREYCARDPRFKLVEQANQGAAAAHNTGVRASSAPLLVLCAADDYLLPAHLRTMDSLITGRPDHQIYSSNGDYLFHETGERRLYHDSEEWRHERSLTLEDLLEQCFFSVGAVYRRETYEGAGGFRREMYVDDYDFWLRAMARGARHLYTPRVLAVHRVSDFQQSASAARVLESDIEAFRYLLDHQLVRDERVQAVLAAIDVRRRNIEAIRTEQRLERVRRALSSVLGQRLSRRVRALGAPLVRWWLARRRSA